MSMTYAWAETGHLNCRRPDKVIDARHLADAPKNIQVIELGKVREKPRWIAHLRFSKRVSGWIAANPQPQRPQLSSVADDGGVIGFVGKEWKRKGLDIAVKVISELRRQRPNLEFIVAGPKPDEIRHLFNDWQGGFQLLGETDSTPLYARFDLLLHPARQEPYGMVIAEARAAAVPVVVSDACDIAAELNETSVLSINDPISDWSTACAQLIGQTTKSIRRDWATVAQDYQRFF